MVLISYHIWSLEIKIDLNLYKALFNLDGLKLLCAKIKVHIQNKTFQKQRRKKNWNGINVKVHGVKKN